MLKYSDYCQQVEDKLLDEIDGLRLYEDMSFSGATTKEDFELIQAAASAKAGECVRIALAAQNNKGPISAKVLGIVRTRQAYFWKVDKICGQKITALLKASQDNDRKQAEIDGLRQEVAALKAQLEGNDIEQIKALLDALNRLEG